MQFSLQDGARFLWKADLQTLKLLSPLDTELVSDLGGWLITGVGDRLLLMVSFDAKDPKNTNLIHEFVNCEWKRQLTLPNDNFLLRYSILQIKATKRMLMVNAFHGSQKGKVD